MIIPAGMQGLGAATPRKTRKITLEPITVEGKVPAAAAAAGAAGKLDIPWKWVAIGGGLLALYLMARHARKGGRGPLALAA